MWVSHCWGVNTLYELLARVYIMGMSCYRLLIFRYLLLVAIGAYIYLFNWNIRKTIFVIAFAFSIIYIYAVTILCIDPIIINKAWAGTSYAVTPYIAPIIFCCISTLADFRFKLLELIGKSSYNIFLTQMVYFSTAKAIVDNFVPLFYVGVIISNIICVTIGLLFYVVESRVTNNISNWLVLKLDLFIEKLKGKFVAIVIDS